MITRINVNPETLLADIQDIYNQVEQELVNNASELINRYDYYTTKFRGDRLNDLNVGIYMGDGRQFVVQVYLANETGTIKKHLKLSRDLRRISEVEELINTFVKPMKYKNLHEVALKVYDEQPFEERLANALELLKLEHGFSEVTKVAKSINPEAGEVIYVIKGN